VWDGGAMTWRELDRAAGGFAAGLVEHGVRRGDRIALLAGDGVSFVPGLLGAWRAGATVAPLNPRLTSHERERILADLDPRLVVEQVLTGPEAAPDVRDPGSPALVLYTSGSTGEPKGAVISHRALAFANRSWAGPIMGLTPGDVVLSALPLAHSLGLNGSLLAPLLAGAGVALLRDPFTPEAALAAIARHRVSVFPAVATMFRRILDSPALESADLSSLRIALSGAAPCPWELAEEWRSRTGVRILRGYGSTELFRPISHLAGDPEDRPGSVGRAVPGVEVRVVNEGGRVLPPGESGELWVKSPACFDGYWCRPAETSEAMEDGWFKTGDLARLGADGFVSIEGRKKELILRGGYSVAPGEVEAVLLTHAEVVEAAVVGVAHAELSEEVAAFVSLRAGARVGPEDLVAYCRERLASFKSPRRVTVLDRLPRGATGKVDRSRLALSVVAGGPNRPE
jgi:long-chain acyl-CoA synthetase